MTIDNDQRVSGLETDVRHLAQTVSGLESDVKNVVRAMDDVSGSLRNLAGKVGDNNKTNWEVLAAWAGVIITVMGAFGYLTVQPLMVLVSDSRKNFQQHVLEPSHGVAAADITSLRRSYDEMVDTQLNSEQSITRILKSQSDHNSIMVGLNATQTTRINYLEKELGNIRSDIMKRRQNMHKIAKEERRLIVK